MHTKLYQTQLGEWYRFADEPWVQRYILIGNITKETMHSAGWTCTQKLKDHRP